MARVLPYLPAVFSVCPKRTKSICGAATKRASCLCQCSIWTAESRLWHVIWHCGDTTIVSEVDITILPAGGCFVQGGAKWITGLRATAHICMWKEPPLGQADTFVHTDGPSYWVRMCLAGKSFPPSSLKSSLPIKTHVASLKKEGTISPASWVIGQTYRDDSCSHKDWLSIHLDIISRVQLLLQLLASLGIGRTSENAPSRGTLVVQQEQHILRESPVVLKSLTLYSAVCVFYTSHIIT